LQQFRNSISAGGVFNMGQPLTGNSQQIWSVNGQLLSEILECSDTDKPLDPSGDIFGPSLSKDSVLYASISTSPDREFALIGAPGISGHKTVAKELVTYPPDQLRAQADPNMYYISPSPPVDLPGLIADQNLGVLMPPTMCLFSNITMGGRLRIGLNFNPA